MFRDAVTALRDEARRHNERRVLVLTGSRTAGLKAAVEAVDAAGISRAEISTVGREEATPYDTVSPTKADALLGTTRSAVILDCHDECRPNAIGRTVGAVDGGGLLILVTPPLDDWPNRRDEFDEYLAVPPATIDDVAGNFRTRLVETLRQHRGIAIYDVDDDVLEADGLTGSRVAPAAEAVVFPDTHRFPRAAYEACVTQDQVDAVTAFEDLTDGPTALVVEADRGRGKSSAAGLAAGSLAAAGSDVLVTAPNYRNAAEVFDRATELLTTLGAVAVEPTDGTHRLEAASGGRIRFEKPPEAAGLPDDPDFVIVDEAAAIPVRLLESFLDADRVAFTTTVHGYEGAGRGFDVRFRGRLSEHGHDVNEIRLDDPIRYAAGDPVEAWAFRALLLDARPAVDQLVDGAEPDDATYQQLSPDDLLADENLLREVFGNLVDAHYRTEPNDLARLLDAPNIGVRALLVDGHVVSVALLAREGYLDNETRAGAFEGERIKGNMIPDVLMSQLRDESAGAPVGMRVMRIATHAAVRRGGLGSRLLQGIRDEFTDVDWLGTGFGATPELVRFWTENGYSTIHLSTTRNATSGEHSAILLDPVSDAGQRLHDRHAEWFASRIESQLGDVLRDVDPDVVRAVLRSCASEPELTLSERDWRLVIGASFGPALYSVDPGPFTRLALWQLITGDSSLLDAREERLLVLKLLQRHGWDAVTERLGYPGTAAAMRALGRAFQPLVDDYAPPSVLDEKERYDR